MPGLCCLCLQPDEDRASGESWLIHSQNARQRFKREIALAASEYKRSLCRNVSRHSDTVFITSQRARFWDELIIIDPSCNCF